MREKAKTKWVVVIPNRYHGEIKLEYSKKQYARVARNALYKCGIKADIKEKKVC